MAGEIDLLGVTKNATEATANQPVLDEPAVPPVKPANVIDLNPPPLKPKVTPSSTDGQTSPATETPLPGSQAEEDFTEFGPRKSRLPHPATQRVLDNMDLTKDMVPSEAALHRAISQATGMPVELARNIHPSLIQNYLDRQDVQYQLELANETRKRLAIDVEAALVVAGSIKPLAASEQALARLGVEIRPPYINYPQPLSMSDEERSVAEGIGLKLLESVKTFAAAIPLSMRREFKIQQLHDDKLSFNELIGDWQLKRHKARGGRPVTPFDIPGDMWALQKRLIGWMTGGPEDVDAHRKEALEISRQLVSLMRSNQNTSSAYAQNFWDRFNKIDKEDSVANQAEAMYDIIVRMPGESATAIAEVMAQSSVPLIAGAVTTAVTKNPMAGMAVTLAGQYGQERYADYNKDLIKKYGKSADLNTKEGMEAFVASPERQDFVASVGEDRALVITIASMLGFKIARFKFTKSAVGNQLIQAPFQGVQEFGGESLAGIYSGQGFDFLDSAMEAMAGFGMSPVELFVAGVDQQRARIAARNAKQWFRTGKDVATQMKDVEPHALVTAAEIMAARLRDEGVTTVFIAGEKLEAFDQDLPSGQTAAETLGLTKEQVRQAAEDGRDIEIGAEAYVRHILGKEGFDALIQHTRFSLEGMTPSEAAEFDATGEASIEAQLTTQVQERLERALGLTEEETTALRDDAEAIAADVKDQLSAMDNISTREADLNSLLTARRYVARAVRATKATGETVSALDLYQRDNVRITNQDTTVRKLADDAGVRRFIQDDVINLDDARQAKELADFHEKFMEKVKARTAETIAEADAHDWTVGIGEKVATADGLKKGWAPWPVAASARRVCPPTPTRRRVTLPRPRTCPICSSRGQTRTVILSVPSFPSGLSARSSPDLSRSINPSPSQTARSRGTPKARPTTPAGAP